MPVFQYKALQGNGAIAQGEIEAGGRQEAFRQMEGRGLRPISLSERRNGASDSHKAPANSSASPGSFNLSLGGARKTGPSTEKSPAALRVCCPGVPLSGRW